MTAWQLSKRWDTYFLMSETTQACEFKPGDKFQFKNGKNTFLVVDKKPLYIHGAYALPQYVVLEIKMMTSTQNEIPIVEFPCIFQYELYKVN